MHFISHRIKSVWLRTIDYFLVKIDTQDSEARHRGRLFVNISASLLITCLALNILIPSLLPLSNQGYWAAYGLLSSLIAGVVLSLFLLQRTGRRLLAFNTLISLIWLIFFGASFYLGGALSPALATMFLLPVIAAIVSGPYLSLIWLVITISSWMFLLILERNAFQFVQIIQAENYSTAFIINLSVACVVVSAAVSIYSRLNRLLRQEISYKNKLLEFVACHDSLTKLPNRRSYYEQLEIAAKRAQRYKQRMALLVMDMDGFKTVNDCYGHHAGDLLLLNIATRLRMSVRQTDFIARLGGDEFVLILDDVNDVQYIQSIAAKINAELSQPVVLQNANVTMSASIGAAVYPDHGEDLKDLQEKADKAMYLAKKNKETCTIWSETDTAAIA